MAGDGPLECHIDDLGTVEASFLPLGRSHGTAVLAVVRARARSRARAQRAMWPQIAHRGSSGHEVAGDPKQRM